MNNYSEDLLVEKPTIELLEALGWKHLNCFDEKFGEGGTLGRETTNEVVLVSKLRPALKKLNPNLPDQLIQLAINEITKNRSVQSLVDANKEVYKLLKDGVKVKLHSANEDKIETVKVIDWDNSQNNDYFLASQFWVTGEIYKRRADLVGFVNGISLIFIELKASHERLENAFGKNLRDYKNTIPQIFWYNCFIILSNGSKSKIGTISSDWEHFSDWKKINSEGEKGIISLDTMIRGTCTKELLLDITENFILYTEFKGEGIKILAKNHQYLGVNNVFREMSDSQTRRQKLGVFWHTQGSGKSFSMIFFAQKVLRKLPGDYTFVVVTDRDELDQQIYKNFASVGVVTEEEKRVRANSGNDLKIKLTEDHRYIFTTIQKFHTAKGQIYPKLSDRSDVIVMTDEAHRTQYDVFALNMRNALPQACFIGFTGTPLMAGEEKTREVFGDYISMYNFKESADDKATVPLYYENRIPELQIINPNFNQDIENVLEKAELDENQEEKLEREFSREYHLITRDQRLDKVAEDIVKHFMGRGYLGKAMVVAIDKATAIKMYEKVKKYWPKYMQELKNSLTSTSEKEEREDLKKRIKFIEEADMAVVVSQSQNEVEDLKKKGLDILPHRKKMLKEDLATRFKDPNDNFSLVFVCAMWMTGFDAPSCSTLYLDKPMRNHTLMQTIARVNRVFQNKTNGLIIDYLGIFKDLQKALAFYGSGPIGGINVGEMPVQDKSVLVKQLEDLIGQAQKFCEDNNIDIKAIIKADKFESIKLVDLAVEEILVSEETKKEFLSLVSLINNYYKAILPDPKANDFKPIQQVLNEIAKKIQNLGPDVDITEIMVEVEDILDKSVSPAGYIIREPKTKYGVSKQVDLTKVDFDVLRKKFEQGQKRAMIERLKNQAEGMLEEMIGRNNTRIDFLEKLQQLVEKYNSGSYNVEVLFDELINFTKELEEEEKRGLREQLSEEELAVFDILTKPDMKLSEKQKKEVKAIAKQLLNKLKQEKIVLDWRNKQQARADVQLTIEKILDQLPENYSNNIYQQKCNQIYLHIYDSYFGQNKSIYEDSARTF